MHDASGQTISILENALFALALFRSRLSENVLEGKEIIERLISFEVKGNFPVYLHEFPRLSDPYLGMRLSPVFFWILHDFSHVIGALKEQLATILANIQRQAKSSDLPPWAAFRLNAMEGMIGKQPKCAVDWGEALISLQIAKVQGAVIEEMIQKASALWHGALQLYVGPALHRHQDGEFPEFTLFDLHFCQWQRTFPKRGEIKRPVHLRGGLVRPLGFELSLEEKPIPYVHFDSEEEMPLLIAWDEHTFVLAKKHMQVRRDGSNFIINYPETIPETEDKSFELNLFLNHHDDHALYVNGKKASCFRFGDEVEIRSRSLVIKLLFSSDSGRFFGHFMMGCRPSQHALRGENQFAAYDFRIAIRTLSRDPNQTIRMQIQMEPAPQSRPPLPLHAYHCQHTALPQ